MIGDIVKRCIDWTVRHSNQSMRTGMLRTGLYLIDRIRNTPGSFCYDVHARTSVDSILPNKRYDALPDEVNMSALQACKKQECRTIRIMYPSGTSWSCIGTLYRELECDSRFDVCVITEDYPAYLDIMEKQKCRFIRLSEYSLEADHPDLLILTSYSYTDPKLNYPGCHEHAGMIVSLFPNVIINEYDMDLHWGYVRNAYSNSNPDYYLFDMLPYRFCEGYIEKTKAIEMGNPLFDELYTHMHSVNEYPVEWKKLDGKRVFLWATDHGLNEYHPIDALSFDLYIKEFFSFFADNQECALIIRCHPYLIREMNESGVFWSSRDFDRLKRFCQASQSIVWDDSPDYSCAFNRCDAMLIDANCGFTVSFLTTLKPMCRLLRSDMSVQLIHPELKDVYYYAKSFKECLSFIEMVKADQDTKLELRREALHASIAHYDGNNGKRIKHWIEEMCFCDKE